MSYFMTEDQILIQNSVHEFIKKPETQKAIAADNAQHGFPERTWKLLVEMGYVGISIPEEYGGQGHDFTTELIVNEVLATYAYPGSIPLAGHSLGMAAIYYWGTEEQKKKFLVPLASGKLLCCGAATDPAGSTNITEWGLTYKEEGKDYILNGTKVIVTNADRADIKVVFGRDGDDGNRVSRAFIVEKGTPGLETGYQEAQLLPGPHDWGTISLKNVRIPKSNCIVDNGFGNKWLSLGFNNVGLACLATAQVAFGMALKYTSQRTNSGRPLTNLQAVAHRLMNMAVANETTKTLVYTAARLWDEGRFDEGAKLGYMAKIYGAEAAVKTIHDATVLHGGIGYVPSSIVGYLNAGIVAFEIAEGCPDILRDKICPYYGIEPVWKKNR
jgi:alkylation response protein AidB-like acyl-CoA dehydrogenase